MQKRTREILALVLLLVLGVGVLCAMGWYILVGHNWNVAASNIDDSIGQMKGYTVFLVKGNKPVPVDPSTDDAAAIDATADGATIPASDGTASMPANGEAATTPDNNAELVQYNGAFEGVPEPSDATDATTVENAEGEAIRTIGELIAEYQDKGAEVYVIESANDGAYGKPVIIESDLQTIGVFRIADPARPAAVRVGTKLLDRVNTDFNILVTNDTNLEGASFKDVGIIVFNPADGAHEDGRYGGNSYCVDTPYEGQVEAIIMSPSGVISSKVIAL